MVKRQTVWLSTMMVLSLMLIGYYTMNGGNQPTSSTGGNDTTTPSVSTEVNTAPGGNMVSTTTPSTPSSTTPSTPTKSQTRTSTSPSTGTGTSQANTTNPNPNSDDWFINYQTQVQQNLTKQEDTLTAVITNNNASTDQVSQAEQQLKALENLDGGIQNARDSILGEGYKEVVIVPNTSSEKVTVYVKANKLSASQAVDIMNIVSQQLNVAINDVNVNFRA